jgi:hypothetical protein
MCWLGERYYTTNNPSGEQVYRYSAYHKLSHIETKKGSGSKVKKHVYQQLIVRGTYIGESSNSVQTTLLHLLREREFVHQVRRYIHAQQTDPSITEEIVIALDGTETSVPLRLFREAP